jgi:hypothetical protein
MRVVEFKPLKFSRLALISPDDSISASGEILPNSEIDDNSPLCARPLPSERLSTYSSERPASSADQGKPVGGRDNQDCGDSVCSPLERSAALVDLARHGYSRVAQDVR